MRTLKRKAFPLSKIGANGGSRTPKPSRALEPKSILELLRSPLTAHTKPLNTCPQRLFRRSTSRNQQLARMARGRFVRCEHGQKAVNRLCQGAAMKPGERFNPYKSFRNIYIPLGIAASTKLSAAAKLTYGALARGAGPNGKRRPEYRGVAGHEKAAPTA